MNKLALTMLLHNSAENLNLYKLVGIPRWRRGSELQAQFPYSLSATEHEWLYNVLADMDPCQKNKQDSSYASTQHIYLKIQGKMLQVLT